MSEMVYPYAGFPLLIGDHASALLETMTFQLGEDLPSRRLPVNLR